MVMAFHTDVMAPAESLRTAHRPAVIAIARGPDFSSFRVGTVFTKECIPGPLFSVSVEKGDEFILFAV
jgi:hypothetical protein